MNENMLMTKLVNANNCLQKANGYYIHLPISTHNFKVHLTSDFYQIKSYNSDLQIRVHIGNLFS